MASLAKELSITLIGSKNNSTFDRQQRRVHDLFLKGEKTLVKFVRESKVLNGLKERYQKFADKNSDLDVLGDDIENKNRIKRLNRRKWFTIAAEALLSFTAIRFFLGETLNMSLPFLPTLFLGIILAYVLLDLAIEFRMDDDNLSESNFTVLDIVKRYSFIVSLVIIPILNLFIILSTPDNPMNALYVFFAIISFLLNLKAASYYKEFRTLSNTQLSQRMNIKMERKITAHQQRLDKIEDQIIDLRNTISKEAELLRSIFESLPVENRKLSIPVKFLFIMNNKIFFTEVFPIPILTLKTPPKGELSENISTWNAFFSTPSKSVELEQNAGTNQNVLESNESNFSNNNKPASEGLNEEKHWDSPMNKDRNPDNNEQNNEIKNDSNPDLGTTISDNEKFL